MSVASIAAVIELAGVSVEVPSREHFSMNTYTQLIFGSRTLWFVAAEYIIAGRKSIPLLFLDMAMLMSAIVYVNSFLASLNCRNKLRRRMMGVVNVDTQLVSSAHPHAREDPIHSHQGSSSDGSSITESGKGMKVSIYTSTIHKHDSGDPYNKVTQYFYLWVSLSLTILFVE